MPSRLVAPGFLLVLAACGCGGALRVDEVKPSVTAPGGHVVVKGAGFADGLALTLTTSGSNGSKIQLQNVTLQDDGSAEADVPGAAPDGAYDLLAHQGGSEARKPDALRVVANTLKVHFLDVGQGDGTLVIGPGGESLLIDGGPRDAAPVVRDAIATLAGGKLDAVVLSHTDADHLGAMVETLAGADGQPGTADDLTPTQSFTYVDDNSCDSQLCGDARDLRAWPFAVARVGDAIDFGEVSATLVAADGDVGLGRISGIDSDNERSVVVRLEFGGRSVLITGDLTGGGLGDENVEAALAGRIGRVDVLRLSHHGSATSSALPTLQAFGPRAVVVSLGTDNAYCHPAEVVTTALSTLGAPVYATGRGIVTAVDRCSGATTWPEGARAGLGSITLEIGADGKTTLAGDPL